MGDCPIEPFVAVADINGQKRDADLFWLQDAEVASERHGTARRWLRKHAEILGT